MQNLVSVTEKDIIILYNSSAVIKTKLRFDVTTPILNVPKLEILHDPLLLLSS